MTVQGDDMSEESRRFALEAAAMLGVRIEPSLLDGVAANLDLLRSHAARVMAFGLAPDVEIAPVFASEPHPTTVAPGRLG